MADSAAALPQASLENGLGLAAEQSRYDGPEQLAGRALAVVERGRQALRRHERFTSWTYRDNSGSQDPNVAVSWEEVGPIVA
jgi:hypothetical protein